MQLYHVAAILLRYDDLLQNPERCFGRLAAFLRLKPSVERLRRAIEKSSFDELAWQEEAQGFVEKPRQAEKFFRAGRAGQWKDVLSQSQVRAVVDAHGPMMMRFVYIEEACSA